MSVQDVIKKSILESFNQGVTLSTGITIAVNLLVAVLMGIIIYFVYKKLYQGVVYSKNYALTLIGMTVLTCMVTLAISTNIVISLGMVGALSIVRYRTAIKEPLDLLYMFWAITTGITVGANMYVLAIIAAVIMIVMMVVAHYISDSNQIDLYVIHFTGDKTYGEIMKLLAKGKVNVRSRIMRGENTELTVEVRTSSKAGDIAGEMNKLEGVSDVTVLQYNGEYHG